MPNNIIILDKYTVGGDRIYIKMLYWSATNVKIILQVTLL